MTVKEVFKKNNDDKLLEAAYSLGLLDYENEQHEVCRRCMLQIARRCRKATNLSNAHKRIIPDWEFWITDTIWINYIIQDSHITTPPWLDTIYGPLILTSLRSIECPVGLNTSEIAAIIAYCLVSEMDLIQATH